MEPMYLKAADAFVFVYDSKENRVGELEGVRGRTPVWVKRFIGMLHDANGIEPDSGTENKSALALVEEMRARAYDTAKAKVCTVLEALMPDRVSGGRLNATTARLLDMALDDMTDAMMKVAQRHFPHITENGMYAAWQDRLTAECSDSADSLRERIRILRLQTIKAQEEMDRLNRLAEG